MAEGEKKSAKGRSGAGMKRRTFIKSVLAICAATLGRLPVFAKDDLPTPRNVHDLDTLNEWIASWGRPSFESTKAVELAPSGRMVEHREYGLAAVVNVDDLIRRERGEFHPEMFERAKNAAQIKAILYRSVAQSIYAIASEGGAVCWRIKPEEDFFCYRKFIPDENGPDVEFISNQKGYSSVSHVAIKVYWRMSFDNERHEAGLERGNIPYEMGYKKEGDSIRFLDQAGYWPLVG